MPDDGIPEGAITRADIAELAALFDRFEFAFDPLARSAKEAEAQFDDDVRRLYYQHVEPAHPEISYTAFYYRVKSLCRAHLRKNL